MTSCAVKVVLGVEVAGRVEARALIVGEEEQLVLLDGAAERAAILIPALARSGQTVEVIRPLVGVEEIVAQIFECDCRDIGWCPISG